MHDQLKMSQNTSFIHVLGLLSDDDIRVDVAVYEMAIRFALRMPSEAQQAVFGCALQRRIVPHGPHRPRFG